MSRSQLSAGATLQADHLLLREERVEELIAAPARGAVAVDELDAEFGDPIEFGVVLDDEAADLVAQVALDPPHAQIAGHGTRHDLGFAEWIGRDRHDSVATVGARRAG